MDGYPISYATAVQVFYITPEPPKRRKTPTPSEIAREKEVESINYSNHEEEEVEVDPASLQP